MAESLSKDNPNCLTTEANMRDWSDLQHDLVDFIAEKLSASVDDCIRLRAVCKAWRSAALAPRSRALPPQLPWLLLSCDTDSKRLSYFSVSDRKTHSIEIPAMKEEQCFSVTCNGWLVLEEKAAFAISLLNPITKKLIPLPSSSHHLRSRRFSCFVFSKGKERRLARTRLVREMAMSANPATSADSCTIVVISVWDSALLSLGPLDDSWSLMDDSTYYRDVVYYKGRFYAVDYLAEVSIFDSDLKKVASIPSPRVDNSSHCQLWKFAQVEGELYVVRTACDGEPETDGFEHHPEYTVTSVDIFKVMLEGELLLKKVKNLDGNVLFCGTSGSLWCPAANYPVGKPNSVYIAGWYGVMRDDDVLAHVRTGVYDLEDHTFRPISVEEHNCNDLVPSIWHTPSLI
ncbi:F-box protein [Canna indica]|uniref:F-box protein n=1 Tax=Canna indica TaxID=4628 RepID=A0AAQ3KFE3_9LILI|nr:F-box protein [Canna indica]